MTLFVPVGLFAVAALGGLIMAVRVFKGGTPPWVLSLLHAAFGAAGLITGLMVIMAGPTPLLWAGLLVLLAAALGGFVLASFHLRGVAHPKPVVALHALLAVGGFSVLAAAAFGVV